MSDHQIAVPKLVVFLDVPDGTTQADLELFAQEFFDELKKQVRKQISYPIVGWRWKVCTDTSPPWRWSGGEAEPT